jgi:hypothetical protein
MSEGPGLEYLLLAALLLVFYAVRDAELLRIGSGENIRPRLVQYGLSNGAAVIAFTTVVDSADVRSFLHQVREPALLKVLLCVQLGIWFYYAWLRRMGIAQRLWTVAILPSPILILCLSGMTVCFPGFPGRTPLTAFAVVTCWVCLIGSLIEWSLRAIGEDPAWGLNFATFSHLFIVFLLPFENVATSLQALFQAVMAHD